jgi:hypothetical protein
MSTVNGYLDTPARPAPERPPFVGLGDHVFDVEEIVHADSPTKGPTVWVKLIVVESPLHPVGSKVTQRFELAKQEKYPTSRTQVELAKDFVAALIGTSSLDVARDTLKMLLTKEDQKIQRARGIRIRARGYAKPGKTWVHVTWANVEQSPADVAARRAAIEAKLAADDGAPAVQAAPVAAPTPAPAPTAAPAAPSLLGGLKAPGA